MSVFTGVFLIGSGLSLAQTSAPAMALTVGTGRPLQIVVDQRITIRHVGQPVAGSLVEPLYAYDRIVVPAGTKVLGHVAALEDPSKMVRTRAFLSGTSLRGGTSCCNLTR